MTHNFKYTTPEQVQAELRATTAFSSATNPSLETVEQWIHEESDNINHLVGKPVGLETYTELIDYNGEEVLLTKNAPIYEVTLFEYNQNPIGSSEGTDWVTKTEDSHFTVYDLTGELSILFNRFSPSVGRKRFRVTYKAGNVEIPFRIQKLCTMMVAHRVLSSLINSNVNEGNDGGSVSVGSISIVEPASYGVNSYNKLGVDIDALKKEVVAGFGVHRYG